ncbi:putative peptidoglycan lipid II flippase [Micromonospora pattaloongensis]|uniref:Putative peptidoglycan lipid II flippase n=1 Tax=Micromonospora pattaloongensis TaxID=405436 RepID=A0A1H3HWH1_9ACTN|nr:murein biosynthesis integral membrane protein MurJ [Micromonospora pattaloongensis]SDY19094.1 putative peptidoglycan lipid II flippase [Micromonospora pattaloongensis]
MSGGLYRSANAGPGGDAPPDDGATLISVRAADQAIAEPPGTGPEPAGDPGAEAGRGSAAGNSAMMAIGSLVSRGTGFLRTAVIAAALGGGLVGDAYTTAQFFPGMIYELLLGGILTSVVIPVLVRRRKTDADRGEAYTQRLLTLAVLTLGATTLLAVLAAPLLGMIYTSDGSTRGLLTALSYLMLPMMFFSGLSAMLSGVLNTRGHFAAPMWAPILNNLVVIGTAGLYILVFGAELIRPSQMTPARVLVIGGGTLLGIVVQSLGLWPALRKVGFRWRWRFDFRALGLRELGRLGGWMFCYVAVSQVGVIVLLRLLSQANAEGNVAGAMIYNNVYLLMMMAHGIVAVSIITALMPRMSAAAADGRMHDLAADLSRGTRMTTAVLAPIAVCYAVLAQPIATTLFNRGAFTRENATATSLVLLVAALALVPFAISQLFTFAFYALPDTKTPALINIPVVLLRVAVQVGVFLAFAAEFTASGLMVGNALSYVAAAVLSAVLLRPRIGRIGLREIMTSFGKVLVAALVAGVAGLAVVSLIFGGGGAADAGGGRNLVALVAGGIVICGVYGAVALALRLREVTDVVAMVRRKIGR